MDFKHVLVLSFKQIIRIVDPIYRLIVIIKQ